MTLRIPETGFQPPLQPSPVIAANPREIGLWEHLEQAIPVKERFDRLRSWRERLSPKFRRAWSAGRLLFQLIGIAGYAGYFASMHTFMRLVSGSLMAGAWYAIYRIRDLQNSRPTESRVTEEKLVRPLMVRTLQE
jgi:hypothetical protein